MPSGRHYHVMPYYTGWCVLDDAQPEALSEFDTREAAILYAENAAHQSQGEVFAHSTRYAFPPDDATHATELPEVPQRGLSANPDPVTHTLRRQKMAVPGATAWPEAESVLAQAERFPGDFDPLLGFDAYYFEI